MNVDKNTYSAIFSDFDGTITSGGLDYTPRDAVVTAVKQWIAAGNIFVITTGRPYAGVLAKAMKRMGVVLPQIVRGGAEIVDPVSGNVIHGEYMPDDEVKRLLSFFQQHDITYTVEKDDVVYTEDGEPVQGYGPGIFKTHRELEIRNIPKVLIVPFSDPKKQQLVDDVLTKEFPLMHVIRATSHFGINWDITSQKATKHLAILRLRDMLQITQEETVGIGDSYNDFPLLSACGYKVAMGNAIEELKAVADFIAPPQKEDGVAYVINRLLQHDA